MNTSPVYQKITGWAYLAAAVGSFYDLALGDSSALGLIFLILGFVIGSIGLVLVFWRTAGKVPALLAAIGLAGYLLFMFSYPNNAEGWIGLVLLGAAFLYFPLAGRFISILWVAAGVLGFPAFTAEDWGLVSAYSIFSVAAAVTGAFVLWGLRASGGE